MRRFLLVLALVLAWDVGHAIAQRTCDEPVYASATNTANNTFAATLAGVANKFIYIHTIDVQMVANAAVTGAAGPVPLLTTSTMFGGAVLVWWGDNSSLTIGQQRQIVAVTFSPFTLRTNVPGNSFTLTSSGGQASQNVRINLVGCYSQ